MRTPHREDRSSIVWLSCWCYVQWFFDGLGGSELVGPYNAWLTFPYLRFALSPTFRGLRRPWQQEGDYG